MKVLIIANGICFISSMLMLLVGLLKNKKKILLVQLVQMILSIISNILLGSLTGCTMNVLGCVRNIILYFKDIGLVLQIILIIASLSLSLPFNTLGFIGLLPVIANVTFLLLMNIKDNAKFKYMLAFTTFLWCIHDLYIQAYVYSFFDLITVISHLITAKQIKKSS